MEKRHAIWIAAALITLMLLFGLLGSGRAQDTAADHIQLYVNGVLVYDNQPAAPTPTQTPRPTATPEPEPVAPYPDAPACPTHDDRAYHGLWDAERGCHYDHEHGDDPHEVDDIFGAWFYDVTGGEIGGPHQTSAYENEYPTGKHHAFAWYVRRDMYDDGLCESQFGDGCIKAFRALVHQTNADPNAKTLDHSGAIEALVCPLNEPDDCGVYRGLFWNYTGDLLVDGNVVIDEARPPFQAPRPVKLHYYDTGQRTCGTWYPVSAFARLSVEICDGWGAILPQAEPVTPAPLFCDDPGDDCRNNGTYRQPHVMSVAVFRSWFDEVDPDGDGRANFEGYADRYGRILDADGQAACEAAGGYSLDCLPVSLGNVATGIDHQFRGSYREYDLQFGGEWSGWPRFQQTEE